jgi:hypothetical protein
MQLFRRSFEKRGITISGSVATNLAFLHSLSNSEFQTATYHGQRLLAGSFSDDLLLSSSSTSVWGSTAVERYAELAVQSDRYNPAALVNMGNALYGRRELDKARDCYHEAAQVRGCQEVAVRCDNRPTA